MQTGQKQELIILGASTFAQEVADLISDSQEYQLVGFVEGLDRQKCQQKLLGLPVLWIDDVATLARNCVAVCAVGSTKRDKFIQQAAALGLNFTKIVHPTARVSQTTSLSPGTVVSAGAIIAAYTRLGQHVIINRGSLIGHHTNIGDYATVSPGANIGGHTNVGARAYIGIGAIVLDHISVGDNCVVGAGAVVTRSVPNNVQVVGIPARITKELSNESG